MSFICYFVNIFLQLLFFFTYHIFCILLFGKGLFEGTGMENNAIFTFILYTCNGICSIKIPSMDGHRLSCYDLLSSPYCFLNKADFKKRLS